MYGYYEISNESSRDYSETKSITTLAYIHKPQEKKNKEYTSLHECIFALAPVFKYLDNLKTEALRK